MQSFWRVLIPVLVLGLASLAAADFDAGMKAYEQGDYARALKEFTRVAEQGDASAQYRLGMMYVEGQGVDKDSATGFTWLRMAADQGNIKAQNMMGLGYAHGEGVKLDYVQAYFWLTVAMEQGEASVAGNRDYVAGKMTSTQIAEAERLAKQWRPTKAKPGR